MRIPITFSVPDYDEEAQEAIKWFEARPNRTKSEEYRNAIKYWYKLKTGNIDSSILPRADEYHTMGIGGMNVTKAVKEGLIDQQTLFNLTRSSYSLHADCVVARRLT